MQGPIQAGFALFPTPPTPPARRIRSKTISSDGQQSTISHEEYEAAFEALAESLHRPLRLSSSRLERNADTARASTSTPLPFTSRARRALAIAAARSSISTENALVPAPLKALPNTPKRAVSANVLRTLEWERARPLQTQPTSPQTPGRQPGNDIRVRSEPPPGASRPTTRASCRISAWLNVDLGEVDHRKLSRYLGGVLDSSFHIGDLPGASIEHERPELLRRESDSNSQKPSPGCTCPPDVIICQCHSSQEFQKFRQSRGEHKSNESVSSTRCFLSVPRARFYSPLGEPEDDPCSPSESTSSSSPTPELVYDSDGSSAADEIEWPFPPSPMGNANAFFPSPITPAPTGRPTGSTKLQKRRTPRESTIPSFSLPLRPGNHPQRQTCRETWSPVFPPKSATRSAPFLGSLSTMSSFAFDFDLEKNKVIDQDSFDTNNAMYQDSFDPSNAMYRDSFDPNNAMYQDSFNTSNAMYQESLLDTNDDIYEESFLVDRNDKGIYQGSCYLDTVSEFESFTETATLQPVVVSSRNHMKPIVVECKTSSPVKSVPVAYSVSTPSPIKSSKADFGPPTSSPVKPKPQGVNYRSPLSKLVDTEPKMLSIALNSPGFTLTPPSVRSSFNRWHDMERIHRSYQPENSSAGPMRISGGY